MQRHQHDPKKAFSPTDITISPEKGETSSPRDRDTPSEPWAHLPH